VRSVDQVGAVVERHHARAVGLQAAIHVFDGGAHALQHHRGVLTPAQQHDALDGLGLLAMADHALARGPALGHLGHVAQEDRRSLVGGHAHLAQILDGVEQPLATDHELLGASFQDSARGIYRAGGDGLLEVRQGQVVARQAQRIGLHVDLALQTAVADHVGHAQHAHQRGPHHPVLQGAQLHGVVVRALQGVAVDLADGSGQGAQVGAHAFGQIRLAQPFQYLLPRGQRIRAILKGQRDVG